MIRNGNPNGVDIKIPTLDTVPVMKSPNNEAIAPKAVAPKPRITTNKVGVITSINSNRRLIAEANDITARIMEGDIILGEKTKQELDDLLTCDGLSFLKIHKINQEKLGM